MPEGKNKGNKIKRNTTKKSLGRERGATEKKTERNAEGRKKKKKGNNKMKRKGKVYGLRTFLWSIGLVYYVGHPQPPQSYWARVYCGCKPGPTRVALHPGRMMEKPERQPYIHWTTFYDFEETRNIELCSYTPPRPVRLRSGRS